MSRATKTWKVSSDVRYQSFSLHFSRGKSGAEFYTADLDFARFIPTEKERERGIALALRAHKRARRRGAYLSRVIIKKTVRFGGMIFAIAWFKTRSDVFESKKDERLWNEGR